LALTVRYGLPNGSHDLGGQLRRAALLAAQDAIRMLLHPVPFAPRKALQDARRLGLQFSLRNQTRTVSMPHVLKTRDVF